MHAGRRLSHYKIAGKIGEGGMGAIYSAFDSRLNRTVALEILPSYATDDPHRQHRSLQEAQSASALAHPNIARIYDLDHDDGLHFIVMEPVQGRPLDALIAESPLPIDRALDYGVQIASALAAAHQAGLVHGDVRSANVLVTRDGHVKVLDFGLAGLMTAPSSGALAPTPAAAPATASGVIVKRAAYSSPEQAEARATDARTDVFAIGAVLYEMLAGRRLCQGSPQLPTTGAVPNDEPAPLHLLRADVPAALEQIVARCLEKDPEKRFASASELHDDLEACWASLAVPAAARRRRVSRAAVAGGIALVAVIAVAAAMAVRVSRARWAHTVALPHIEALVAADQPYEAFQLLRQVQTMIPSSPEVLRVTNDVVDPIVLRTEPADAEVYAKSYLDTGGAWIAIGRTPLQDVPVPFGYHRWRLVKDGYETREIAAGTEVPTIPLTRHGHAPAGMVLVPAAASRSMMPPVALTPFWIDRFEVTNRDFKRFIDAGGYENQAYWTHPFVKDGRTIAWREGIRLFRDATGRAGPALWRLSTYPEGHGDLPVTGVSWFEAAAYAEYVRKNLPTLWHWYAAASQGIFSEILSLSNFSGKGLASVGKYQGLGPYGTFDMAGNAKEWCFNATGAKRFILGGAWNEPSYKHKERDAQDPFAREPNFGFRCAKYPSPVPEPLTEPVETAPRDYSKERPATAEIFRALRQAYAYDRTPLNARVEMLADDSPRWRREKIAVDAAYEKQRVPAFLFLPRNASPPFQTVVFFPSSQAFALRSSRHLETRLIQFLMQNGRAVLYPIYRGTFDRWLRVEGPFENRDLTIQDVKDFSRYIDYLETRSDIDTSRLAYYGIGSGANIGPIVLATDSRMKAAVLLGAGFPSSPQAPEIDLINFAPRVTVPVLMLNGRYDFIGPVEGSQRPLFEALGTAPADKRHVLFNTGRAVMTVQPMIKEVLDWLDKYLGPVRRPAR